MQFCPKCGSVLINKGKRFACPKCRYSSNNVQLFTSENIKQEAGIDLLREKESNVWPTVNANCKRCGNLEAETWATQMRAGDEGETVFFRCKKCKFTWRERE